MGGKTLLGRLFLLTSIWAVLSTALIAFLITTGYKNRAEQRLNELLTANLYNLMGAVEPDQNGKLSGLPDLRDARFSNFRSGYYWSVHEINDPNNRLSSLSLNEENIFTSQSIPFDSRFQRKFKSTDAGDNQLIGVEAHVFLGEGDDLYSFKITANENDLSNDIGSFVQQLLILLSIFAVGFILASYFIVKFGLSPLKRISEGLGAIREGRADRLDGEFPLEITPLVDETNSLIKSNNNVIERARTQVGNLAHSLKTPIAVLKNESKNASPKVKKIIDQQTQQMQDSVQTYLDRARIAARVGTIHSRTKLAPVLEKMFRVMQKLNPDIKFELILPDQELSFAGEQQDLEEMIGNLLENASKFAEKKVHLILEQSDLKKDQLKISIEDDGPGLDEAEQKKAMTRGVRLDESKPGSGLGLSIVKDITSEYDGELILSEAKLGGLRVELILPKI